MKTAITAYGLLLILLVQAAFCPQAEAARLSKEQRQELAAIKKDLAGVTKLVRTKKFDEAEVALTKAAKQIDALKTAAGLPDSSPIIRRLLKTLSLRRVLLEKRMGAASGKKPGRKDERVSFSAEIAPLLVEHCVSCHGPNNPRARLRLDSFAGMKRGGKSGPLLVIGQPEQSLIGARLIAPAKDRMPKGGEPLPLKHLHTIEVWIRQGAVFDGKDEKALLSELPKPGEPEPAPVQVAMATGKESVSFKNEIAPFMANLCLRCHNDDRKSGGLSIATFEQLLIGGKSGPVVKPGDLDGSRLWALVGKQDPFKMPRGNARLLLSDKNKLEKWIREGVKYDGGDPKKPLRELVPTPASLQAKQFERMTPVRFSKWRVDRTQEAWKRAFPKQKPRVRETSEYFLIGNVSEQRLGQTADWAVQFAAAARTQFGIDRKQAPLFSGRLAVIVLKDRSAYEEFNLTIAQREIPPELFGHVIISENLEDAYVVLYDVGDTKSRKSPGFRFRLVELLTEALLRRDGPLPAWILHGMGRRMAVQSDPRNDYVKAQRSLLTDYLKTLQEPVDVFKENAFSQEGTGTVGHSLVEFLIKSQTETRFLKVLDMLHSGSNQPDAYKAVYNATPTDIVTAYSDQLKRLNP